MPAFAFPVNKTLLPISLLFITALLGLSFLSLSGLEILLLGLTFVLLIHGAVTNYAMLYSFLDDRRLKSLEPLPAAALPQTTFSLIVPARNEAAVIGSTLNAMARIDYPQDLYEVLIMVRADDIPTLTAVQATLANLNRSNLRLIEIDGDANTKAYSLNLGAHYAIHKVIGIFDAEDEPQPQLLRSLDAEFQADPQLQVIQAAVQLVNLNSNWFAAINCLEYYFWFKSVLPFLSQLGATPLGGNTVFFQKELLKAAGFWDETCLTEDADIGIRVSSLGAKIKTIYQSHLATLEETPKDELGFIRQRSRWDQGFLQVIGKGNWTKLPTKNRYLTLYILMQPIFRTIFALNFIIFPLLISYFSSVALPIAMIAWIPGFFVLLQLGLYITGLSDLKDLYPVKVTPSTYLRVILLYFPYQILLLFGSLRAFYRLLIGQNVWDKTMHFNLHRAYQPAAS